MIINKSLKIFFFFSLSLSFLACSNNQISNEIDWEKCPQICNTLVFYATEHSSEPIPPSIPVFVASNLSKLDPKNEVFPADIVPYASLELKNQILEEISKIEIKWKQNPKILKEILNIKTWVKTNVQDGKYISYVLEPASIAGKGNAHVLRDKFLSEKKKMKEIEQRMPYSQ